MPIVALALRNPVLKQCRRDSNRVQPFANLSAFEISGEDAIAAAWANQHRAARVLFVRRPINAERRFRYVAQTYNPLTGDHSVLRFGRIMLFTDNPLLPWWGVWP